MEFQIEKLKTYTLIKVLAARLETKIASDLKSELVLISGKGEKNIVLDLCNCNYCDAAGLSAVLAGNRLCHNSGGVFVLSGLNGSFERLISTSHLDSILSITSGIKDAESLLQEGKSTSSKNEPSVSRFKIDKFESYTLINVLEERLDTSIAPILKDELASIYDSGVKNIILDLSNCSFCDPAGLSIILIGNRLCKNSGGILILSGLNDAIKRFITISQLDGVLSITGSVPEAEILIKGTN